MEGIDETERDMGEGKAVRMLIVAVMEWIIDGRWRVHAVAGAGK